MDQKDPSSFSMRKTQKVLSYKQEPDGTNTEKKAQIFLNLDKLSHVKKHIGKLLLAAESQLTPSKYFKNINSFTAICKNKNKKYRNE